MTPATVKLTENFARLQLIVTAPDSKGSFSERSADLTGKATYRCANTSIATVTSTGRLLAVGNGATTVTVAVAGVESKVPVQVTGVSARPVIGFTDQVLPLFSRAGCNAGACHAAQYGQGGRSGFVGVRSGTNHPA